MCLSLVLKKQTASETRNSCENANHPKCWVSMAGMLGLFFQNHENLGKTDQKKNRNIIQSAHQMRMSKPTSSPLILKQFPQLSHCSGAEVEPQSRKKPITGTGARLATREPTGHLGGSSCSNSTINMCGQLCEGIGGTYNFPSKKFGARLAYTTPYAMQRSCWMNEKLCHTHLQVLHLGMIKAWFTNHYRTMNIENRQSFLIPEISTFQAQQDITATPSCTKALQNFVELLALQALTWPAEQPRYDGDEAMKSANVVSPNLSTLRLAWHLVEKKNTRFLTENVVV